MCIAILVKKEATISDEALRNSFDSNPDGAGVAYAVDGKLVVKKTLSSKDFIKMVHKGLKERDGAMLIHCRIGTSGTKDLTNVHPFYVNKDSVLIHNGILDVQVPKNSAINDTQIFINSYMRMFTTKDLFENAGLKSLIEMAINSNKFVLLNDKSEFTIYNEQLGSWDKGVWYSNKSYEPKVFYDNWSFVGNNGYNRYCYGYYNDDDEDDMTINEFKDFLDIYDDEELFEIGTDPYYDFNSELLCRKEEASSYSFELRKERYDLYKEYLRRYDMAVTNYLESEQIGV